MSEQISFLIRILPELLIGFPNMRPGGLLLSVLLTAASLVVGTVVGAVAGAAHHSRFRIVRFVARTYIQVIRGIPLIVQLVLIHTTLGAGRIIPGLETSALQSAFVTLVLYSSAYLGDVIRAGIGSVPESQIDDARLLGAGSFTLLRTLLLPTSFRVMRPALITQAITVFKDSSVVVVLGVADLTTNARIALGGDVGNAPFWVATYLLVGALYWSFAWSAGRFAERFVTPAENTFETITGEFASQ